MLFDDTVFFVPEDGIYYIYGMLVIADDDVQDSGFQFISEDKDTTVRLSLGSGDSSNTLMSVTDLSVSDADITITGNHVERLAGGSKVKMTTHPCRYTLTPITASLASSS